MKIFFALFLSFLSFYASAQLKQKTADRYFKNLEYSKCVTMYDELANKCSKGRKSCDWENVRKSAESHYHLFEMNQSVTYYEKLHSKNLLFESDRVYYIQALRYLEKYGKSEAVITESANLFPQNKFFKRLKEDAGTFSTLYMDSAFYSIRKSSINSDRGDFGVAYFSNSIVFASKSKNTGFANQKYGWDDDFYLNIMQSTFGKDSILNEPKLLKHNFISRAHDGPVSFNADGTQMIITKNTLGKNQGKDVVVLSIYFSDLVNNEWTELVPFEFNNSAYNVGHGVFSEDGNKMYFVSDQPGGLGEADIYYSTRLGKGWSTPINLGNTINTERDEMFPFVQKDILYFSSNGHYGLGGLDLFEAAADGTTKPKNIGFPVNTSFDDFGLIFDRSEAIGYLSSNRGDNIDRIYHVKKRKIDLRLDGIVYEKYMELEPSSNQIVWIKNMTSQELDSVTTDAEGKFTTPLRLNQEYRIFTKKQHFILLKEASLSTEEIKSDSTFYCELVLKPTTIKVHLRVIEKATEKVIPMAIVTITDYNLKWDTTLITNEFGIVTLDVDRNKVLWAHGSKKGYIDGDISFNTTNENDKIIDIELALPLIKKGEKFKLENIFYDLNKSTLRPESMASLDKLADFLIKNNLKIELSAHTDSRGSDTYNQKLSQARAQSCVDYLLKKNVPTSNMKAKGYGESQLVNRCKNGVLCSEDEHQENRRTEVKITEVN